MAETIGQRLREARKKKGLSLEDVAHATRIHINNIRALETDEYGQFSSPTYAKSFLQLYSRYLDIDAKDTLARFSAATAISAAEPDNEIRARIKPLGIPDKAPRKTRQGSEKPGGAPVFLGIALILLLIAIPTFYFLGFDADSPEEAKEEIAKRLGKKGDGDDGDKEKKDKETPDPEKSKGSPSYPFKKDDKEPEIVEEKTEVIDPTLETPVIEETPGVPSNKPPLRAVPIDLTDPQPAPPAPAPPEVPEPAPRPIREIN